MLTVAERIAFVVLVLVCGGVAFQGFRRIVQVVRLGGSAEARRQGRRRWIGIWRSGPRSLRETGASSAGSRIGRANCAAGSMAPHLIARLGVGYCPEERGIFASLSAEENLLLPPRVGSSGMSLDEIYQMFPNLYERRRSQGSRLSGGEQPTSRWPSEDRRRSASGATPQLCGECVVGVAN